MANSSVINLDDHDDADDITYGYFKANIVGLRYYKGRVNANEMVSLNREPHNRYDCNALRVDNVFGVQVGHIKREQAKALAKIVDKNKARLEGVVPYGFHNQFTMPCHITLLGKETDKDSVILEMRRSGYPLTDRKASRPAGFYESDGQNMSVSMKVSPQAMKKEIDNLFMKLTESETKSASHEAAEAIKTPLLPHQKQALAWMMSCENDENLPPFWEEKGPQDFFNSATNCSANKKPKSVKGGILADDMGLGKTLEIIALIITNFKNGKNLVTIDKSKPLVLNPTNRGLVPPKKKRKQAKVEVFDEISGDENCEEELPDLPSFESKDDPEFKIIQNGGEEQVKKSPKYPKRVSKRPAKYTFEDEDEAEAIVEVETKKPQKRRKSAKQTAKGPAVNGEVASVVGQAMGSKLEDIPDGTQVTAATAVEIFESVNGNAKTVVEPEQRPEVIVINDAEIPVLDTVEVEAVAEVMCEVTPARKRRARSSSGKSSKMTMMNEENVESFKGKRTKASGARATLIICPLSVLSNWQDQLSSHVWPGLLEVYTYYGADRTKDCDVLAQKDIVLTTYQTLTADFNKKNCPSPLQNTKWLRVVLDEGHCIRNSNTQQSKATHALNAERRWIVTGTPIQNSMKDLFSLVCFLQLEPFTDRQWWSRVMERPIKEGEKDALVRLQQLMKCIAIRRTKNQKVNGKPLIDLPAKNVYINYIELSAEERDVYQAFADKGKTTIGKYMKAGTVFNNYGEVLVILTRLRQLCCHPKLCTAALEAAAKEAVESSTPEELRKRLTSIIAMVLSSGVDEECPICLCSLNLPVITHCAHIYCKKCIESVIALHDAYGSRCPLCRDPIALDKLVEPPADQDEESFDDNQWNSSAKVDALMLALEKQRQTDPLAKCLVVSQFTSFLKLLKHPLEGRGFNYVTLDGSMTQEKRAAAIRNFSDMKTGSPTVFLLSLKAGGVGLNLSAATAVYLMDPAWNPAAEDQCYDRCHRLGQTKEVNIYKFIIKNSIEERMLEMQDKKRKLMSGAFGKQKAEERRQQRINDLNVLIR